MPTHRLSSPEGDEGLIPTIASRLTPAVPSAIATIALHGPRSQQLIARLFSSKRKPLLAVDDVSFGQWNPAQDVLAAEQVVVCRIGEDQFEIHAHGGAAVCRMILDDLHQAGCEILPASEWPADAGDKLRAQAELDLQHAGTVKVAAMLLDQMRGALSSAIASIIADLESSRIAAASSLLSELLHWGQIGVRLCRTQRVCLAGPPNAGKSSLLNAMLGVDRVIVHHQPGTTRDAIEATIAIDGWPVTLIDTAGIRATEEPIEHAGIQIARHGLAQSDLAILVVDATVGWTSTHAELLELIAGKTIIAWNKSDLSSSAAAPISLPLVHTSAVQIAGVEPLLAAIAATLFTELPPAGQPVPFRQEHLDALAQAMQLLTQSNPRAAIAILKAATELE